MSAQRTKQFPQSILKDTGANDALFTAAVGLVCGEEFSGVADLAEALFNALTGNSDPQPDYTAALNQLSSQLNNIQTVLSNLATSEVYQQECLNITSTIMAMQSNVSQGAENLDPDQINAMCTFLSPGASALNQPDYQSAVNDLLVVTYGTRVTIQTLVANTAPQMGENTTCEAFAIANNGAGSSQGQGFYDFVKAQINLSVAVSLMIVSITNTANQVYTCLSSNQQYLLGKYTDKTFTENLTSTLSGPTMLADVSNPLSGTYLTTILGPYLINAPQALCGNLLNFVYYLNENANSGNYDSGNPSFALINPADSNTYATSIWWSTRQESFNPNVLSYEALVPYSYFWPSYYNSQPGNQLLLQSSILLNGAPAYFAIPTQDDWVVGTEYPSGDGIPNSYFAFDLMVYMPSLGNICFVLYVSAIGQAIGNIPFINSGPNGPSSYLLSVPFDCTNPNQQFQLQFQDIN